MSKSNVFADRIKSVAPVKRNTFDLSYQNNGSFKFGKLYPVLCKEVLPGDSFRIQDTFGLKFAPLVFPVQTRMRACINYFYVRNRNLWKGWPDFIGKTDPDLIAPYISSPSDSDLWKTGELADWLGAPTAYYEGVKTNLSIDSNEDFVDEFGKPTYCSSITRFYSQNGGVGTLNLRGNSYPQSWANPRAHYIFHILQTPSKEMTFYGADAYPSQPTIFSANVDLINSAPVYLEGPDSSSLKIISRNFLNGVSIALGQGGESVIQFTDEQLSQIQTAISNNSPNGIWLSFTFALSSVSPSLSTNFRWAANVEYLGNSSELGFTEISNNPSLNPFSSDKNNGVHLSALPFRAYESIYNAFYRNQQNDPFRIRGKVEYNKFITNNDDGADATDYHLYSHNWELDQFTSALPSPQQGVAPLVGVSVNGEFTFASQSPESPNDTINFSVKTRLDEDGNIVGVQGYQDNGVDSETVQGSIQRLNQAIMSGISINDFRNVNSLQRWLETNMRRGFRYKDQLMSHFGVDAKFEELDMPEYLGGHIEDVVINQISQTTDGDGNSSTLGSFAGQANCFGQGRSISSYFDEHGFVIGIMHIVPVPNYSQTLPKHFTKFSSLDYYFPEFAHIGPQAIPLRELVPLQVYKIEPSKLNDTFGYQRAWYEYIASLDEVHGQLRTSLADFLINRKFEGIPQLGHDFLAVDDKSVNAPFAVVDENDDKIFGQIYFNISAKRPISRFGIPRLE